jgi:plastocyanin
MSAMHMKTLSGDRIMMAALLVILSAGCRSGERPESTPGGQPMAEEAKFSGAVTGTASFDYGEPYFPQPIQMSADPVCVELHPTTPHTEFVIAGDGGGLKNVFVYVKTGIEGTFPVPDEPVVLDQRGCVYEPHVFGLRAGQTLSVRNSDDTLHNIHAMPEKNKEFNVGQPVQGLTTERVFEVPEVMVPFKCDVHKWMNAYAGVVAHPYFAVTDADGRFRIENLPKGDYVIEAWHERFGTQEVSVSVGEDETGPINFSFGAE